MTTPRPKNLMRYWAGVDAAFTNFKPAHVATA